MSRPCNYKLVRLKFEDIKNICSKTDTTITTYMCCKYVEILPDSWTGDKSQVNVL